MAVHQPGPLGGASFPPPPKRRKTPRACDYCRDHKLRCDFSHELKRPDGKPLCKHCSDFGIDCVITAPSERRRTSITKAEGSALSSSADASTSTAWLADNRALDDPRYSGESSLSAIISHFIMMIGNRRDQQLQTIHRQLSTDGVQSTGSDNFLLLPQVRYPPPPEAGENELLHARLVQDDVRLLVERYLTYIQPLNSIVSRRDVLDSVDLEASETPISALSHIALSLLCVSAMYRETPRFVRSALLFHQRQRRMAVFRTSVETVQSLLLLSQNIELMAPDTNDAAGMSFNITGLAVRMAQDLGMHRDTALLGTTRARQRKLARVWSSCVLVDRWYSLCYGQPQLIHMDDCDTLPPSVFDDEDEGDGEQVQGTHSNVGRGKAPYDTHVAHYEFAMLIARVHKVAFGPRGFNRKSYPELKNIIAEAEDWTARLPPHLHFSMRHAHPPSVESGFLFAMRVSIDFLLYRVSLNLPSVTAPLYRPDKWQTIVRDSAEVLEWLASPDGLVCLDSYSIVLYLLIQCTIVHFYEACRGGSLHCLRVARQSLQNRGTVATQAASRGQIYDPYGPQDKEQQANSASASTFAAPGARKHSELPSPSPETAGAPRLLRLRVKISALVSMLLEVAEHRRAAVFSRCEDGEEDGRGVAGSHQTEAVSSPSSSSRNGRVPAQSAVPSPTHVHTPPNIAVPQYHPSLQLPQNGSPYAARAMLNHSAAASAAAVGAGGMGLSGGVHLSGQTSLPMHHPDPAGLPASHNQPPYYPQNNRPRTTYEGTPTNSHGSTASPSNIPIAPPNNMHDGMPFPQHMPLLHRDTASLGGMPANGAAFFASPNMASPHSGNGFDAAAMSSFSSKAFEDADLLTLQRWAGALLTDQSHSLAALPVPPMPPLADMHPTTSTLAGGVNQAPYPPVGQPPVLPPPSSYGNRTFSL